MCRLTPDSREAREEGEETGEVVAAGNGRNQRKSGTCSGSFWTSLGLLTLASLEENDRDGVGARNCRTRCASNRVCKSC